MEDGIPNPIRAIRVSCHAIWANQRLCRIPTHDEWYTLRVSQPIHGSRSRWHPRLLPKSRFPWVACPHGAVKTSGTRSLHYYEKCAFKQFSIEFLGYIISPDGISMDQHKVAAIQEWQPPTQVRDLQSFLSFANFYRRFIKGLSKSVQPLVILTRKDRPFYWTLSEQSAFMAFKSAFITA